MPSICSIEFDCVSVFRKYTSHNILWNYNKTIIIDIDNIISSSSSDSSTINNSIFSI